MKSTDRIFIHTHPYQHQAGVLASSMHNVEKTGKTFVSTETALASIASHSQPALAEVIEQTSLASDSSIKMVDITHTAVSSAHCLGPELPKSKISIYQGIIANLISWGRDDCNGKLCGILAGDSKTVLDVIMCKDLTGTLSLDVLKTRWDTLNVFPMGIAFWTKDTPSIDQFNDWVKQLKSPFEELVFVFMNGGDDPVVWDISVPENGSLKACRCSGPKKESGRKKDHKYRVVDIQAVGKNTMTNMTDTMSKVFQDYVKDIVAKKMIAGDTSSKRTLQEHCVPADGMCFWHSELAGLDFESWLAIPRKTSGYATNKRILKAEAARAQALLDKTMDTASQQGVDSGMIAEICGHGGSVDVHDLVWICKAMGINVRCTIAEEAGFVGVF